MIHEFDPWFNYRAAEYKVSVYRMASTTSPFTRPQWPSFLRKSRMTRAANVPLTVHSG